MTKKGRLHLDMMSTTHSGNLLDETLRKQPKNPRVSGSVLVYNLSQGHPFASCVFFTKPYRTKKEPDNLTVPIFTLLGTPYFHTHGMIHTRLNATVPLDDGCGS